MWRKLQTMTGDAFVLQKFLERALTVWFMFLAVCVSSNASDVNEESLAAWDDYVHSQSARLGENSVNRPFLWSDQSRDRIRRLREGEILVAPVGENPKIVPHALIHHWIGALFLPGAELDDVLVVVRDYDKYKEFYAPNVIASRLLRHGVKNDAFSLRMLNKALVAKFALDAEFENSYVLLAKTRAYSVGHSTRIREIQNYGQLNEHALPPNTGHGFIWRLTDFSRFEQRDGGVYIELEAIALSRDVPAAFRWVADPAVRRVSRSSMLVSLQKTQQAVYTRNERVNRLGAKERQIEERSINLQNARLIQSHAAEATPGRAR